MKKSKMITILFLFAVGLAASLFAAEIHEAVKTGDLNAVKALIEKDPGTINAKDETGRTPLHWAARGTNNEILAYLAEKGAELNALDNNGTAPLHSLPRQHGWD